MRSPVGCAGQTAHGDQLSDQRRSRTVRITARWHPSRELDLPVVRWETKTHPPHVTVRLPDGSGVRVPLSWTDACVAESVAPQMTRCRAGADVSEILTPLRRTELTGNTCKDPRDKGLSRKWIDTLHRTTCRQSLHFCFFARTSRLSKVNLMKRICIWSQTCISG